jgi:hypothetical protein
VTGSQPAFFGADGGADGPDTVAGVGWLHAGTTGLPPRGSAFGSTSYRRNLASVSARANNYSRAALPLNHRHDSPVHFTAFLPSLETVAKRGQDP